MILSNLCVTTLLSASLLFSGGTSQPATTAISTESVNTNTAVACSVEITPRIDVQEWVYMVSDGMGYKRLWSKTRGIFLTDWIPML